MSSKKRKLCKQKRYRNKGSSYKYAQGQYEAKKKVFEIVTQRKYSYKKNLQEIQKKKSLVQDYF